jgi:O2-independent ubiquinone biosynthesis accessory factor UbiT
VIAAPPVALLAARLRPLLERLPMQPPALALAAALNRWLLPRLPADARAALSGQAVQIAVTDLGLVLALRLDPRGFHLAPARAPIALRIAAAAPVYWRLLRGQDDADRLFFERALVMEGDTELGLVLKNTLDAIGPLWT